MRALTLERWASDPDVDTADPSDIIPYSFTWTDTADPTDLEPYAFSWDAAEPQTWDDAADPNWSAGLQGVGAGAGTGAAVGAAIGSVFPGIGTAVGGAVGTVVGAIGGFIAGLFGGGKPKPTPRWVIDVLEEGRRALKEVPPNPSKMIDATLVTAGKFTKESYLRAKTAGQLPSQKYDRNRTAAMTKSLNLDKKFGPQIAANLKGLTLGEKALVSAAMPLGHGRVALDAVLKIRAHTDAVTRPRRDRQRLTFSADAVEKMRRQYLAPRPADEQPPDLSPEPATPPPLLVPSAVPSEDSDEADTSGPSPYATAPTLEDLPKPLWHVSMSPLPRDIFERLLHAAPILQQVPMPLLRAAAGQGPKVQDTSGIDPVTRHYVMMPGETFAGIAAQLTGDPGRAVELHAANPHWSPERMRLEIPPGWLEWTPLLVPTGGEAAGFDVNLWGNSSKPTEIKPEEDPPKPKESKAAAPPAAPQGKDGPRPSMTKRVIEVLANDWPEKIATRTGAKTADPQWFKALKRANPHKVIAQNGNFQTLFAGELLNYPDTWPQHAEAKPAPGQGALPNIPPNGNGGIVPPGMIPPDPQPAPPPGTAPAGATADPGTTLAAQGILTTFATKHPEVARPQDYGRTIGDVSGIPTERMRSIASTFQMWWNTRKPPLMLRVDGVIDPATFAALKAYAVETLKDAPIPINPNLGGGASPPNNPGAAGPGGASPPHSPSPPGPGGKGGGAPGGDGPPPGGGAGQEPWSPGIYYNPYLQPVPPPGGGAGQEPWSPGIYYNPYLQPVPPPTVAPAPAEDKPAETHKDDGAAALMVGGTVLSLLLR